MKEDRRIRHTKERITSAMLKCLCQNKPGNITVKEICELADINRSTFYAHYKNPIELFEEIEREALEGIASQLKELKKNNPDYKGFLVGILGYISEHKETFLAIMKSESKIFEEANLSLIGGTKFDFSHIPSEDMPYAEIFYINGMLSIVEKWLEDGTKISPKHMAELIFLITAK